MADPVVLIGTGTSVGKTYVGERLLRAVAAEGHTALGYKPIESGVSEGSDDTDIARLARASTFHVKPALMSMTFREPVSPHLAARIEAREISLDALREEIRRACASAASLVVVELPGGAFSPMTESVCCAEFARSLPGARTLLVAADRLGVLHDIGATTRACAALGLPLLGIVLSAPAFADAATGHNALELPCVTRVPLLASLPRIPAESTLHDADPLRKISRELTTRW
ncbi:MAG: dethiobiotin synthase [Polyangiaceae bacterium]